MKKLLMFLTLLKCLKNLSKNKVIHFKEVGGLYNETISQLLDIMFNNRKIVYQLKVQKELLEKEILELKLAKNTLESIIDSLTESIENIPDHSEECQPSGEVI